MAITRKKKPELKVIFDSNVLYTGSASDLLSHDVAQLIREHSNHPDLTVTWYLPDIVIHERQYQMLKRGQELLPAIQKLEKLLGHNLNITESVIESRVKEIVESQLQEHSIQVFHLETAIVDWSRVILDAAYRHPPFQGGEKEKGFRDALVAEAFMQIVSKSPSTPKICRVVLVTGDHLLKEAVQNRTNSCTNVRLVSTQEELKSLINTLVADVNEEYVAKIQEQATKYFFTSGDESTLYYREGIADQIRQSFTPELDSPPEGSDRRKNETWRISAPRFAKKEGQRISWISRISIEAKAYIYTISNLVANSGLRFDAQAFSPTSGQYYGNIGFPTSPLTIQPWQQIVQSSVPLDSAGLVEMPGKFVLDTGFAVLPTPLERENLVAEGETIFEVAWSISVSANQKFSNPKIDSIAFVETVWE